MPGMVLWNKKLFAVDEFHGFPVLCIFPEVQSHLIYIREICRGNVGQPYPPTYRAKIIPKTNFSKFEAKKKIKKCFWTSFGGVIRKIL